MQSTKEELKHGQFVLVIVDRYGETSLIAKFAREIGSDMKNIKFRACDSSIENLSADPPCSYLKVVTVKSHFLVD